MQATLFPVCIMACSTIDYKIYVRSQKAGERLKFGRLQEHRVNLTSNEAELIYRLLA